MKFCGNMILDGKSKHSYPTETKGYCYISYANETLMNKMSRTVTIKMRMWFLGYYSISFIGT